MDGRAGALDALVQGHVPEDHVEPVAGLAFGGQDSLDQGPAGLPDPPSARVALGPVEVGDGGEEVGVVLVDTDDVDAVDQGRVPRESESVGASQARRSRPAHAPPLVKLVVDDHRHAPAR